eukprot:1183085-Prorocentrum_minimum.AAC.1
MVGESPHAEQLGSLGNPAAIPREPRRLALGFRFSQTGGLGGHGDDQGAPLIRLGRSRLNQQRVVHGWGPRASSSDRPMYSVYIGHYFEACKLPASRSVWLGLLQVGGVIAGLRIGENEDAEVGELADGIWLSCMLTGLGLQTFADRSELKGLELQIGVMVKSLVHKLMRMSSSKSSLISVEN